MGNINIDSLSINVEQLLDDYKEFVEEALDDGLDAAEKILINNLKSTSPKDSGKYAKSWKSKGKKYKHRRYVGNTKTVPSKKRGNIPLSNILEYGSDSKHQGKIKATYLDSVEQMADAIEAEMKKGG